MTETLYGQRRTRVLERLGDTGALIVAAPPQVVVGGDSELRYLPGADLFYLTGYTEPDAVLVLCPSADAKFTLFVRPRDSDRERWTGVRGGVEAAREQHGADAAFPIAELAERLPKIVAGARTLYAHVHPASHDARADLENALHATLASARATRPRTGRGITTLVDPAVLLAPMRLRKDAHEIALMRRAARITVDAFNDAIAALRTADGEWQVEAALEHGFRVRGATGPAFPSIVAGGTNATVLHYTDNSAPLRSGDALLIDAGARYEMYCADITRTVPIGDTFTGEQQEIHDIVLRAHDAAIAAARPGAPVTALDDAALAVLVDGMRHLRLLDGTRDASIENRTYRQYYPHRTSHWLGIDVHDVGDYAHSDGSPVLLEEGMVLTVEPGLYIPERRIGIRIEDDVLITAQGPEVLTA